jgi:hypothetical protein
MRLERDEKVMESSDAEKVNQKTSQPWELPKKWPRHLADSQSSRHLTVPSPAFAVAFPSRLSLPRSYCNVWTPLNAAVALVGILLRFPFSFGPLYFK